MEAERGVVTYVFWHLDLRGSAAILTDRGMARQCPGRDIGIIENGIGWICDNPLQQKGGKCVSS